MQNLAFADLYTTSEEDTDATEHKPRMWDLKNMFSSVSEARGIPFHLHGWLRSVGNQIP